MDGDNVFFMNWVQIVVYFQVMLDNVVVVKVFCIFVGIGEYVVVVWYCGIIGGDKVGIWQELYQQVCGMMYIGVGEGLVVIGGVFQIQ